MAVKIRAFSWSEQAFTQLIATLKIKHWHLKENYTKFVESAVVHIGEQWDEWKLNREL
jgi:hypothetical protein